LTESSHAISVPAHAIATHCYPLFNYMEAVHFNLLIGAAAKAQTSLLMFALALITMIHDEWI